MCAGLELPPSHANIGGMTRSSTSIKCIVTAFFVTVGFSAPCIAQDQARLAELYEQLSAAEEGGYERIERQIYDEWGKSGSAAMDLLVRRGRDALDARDHAAAVDHFSALVDHAPDFAEGYAGRATAYFHEGQYGLAIDDLREVLNRDPNHYVAITGLAVILEDLGRNQHALDGYREVLRIHPNQPEVLVGVERLEALLEGQAL